MHTFTAVQIGVLVLAICFSVLMVSEGQETASAPATVSVTTNCTTGNSTTDVPTSDNNCTTGNSTTDAPTSGNNCTTGNSTTDAPTSGNPTTDAPTSGNNTTDAPTSGNNTSVNPTKKPGSPNGTTAPSAASRPLPAGTFSSFLAGILAATLLVHLSW